MAVTCEGGVIIETKIYKVNGKTSDIDPKKREEILEDGIRRLVCPLDCIGICLAKTNRMQLIKKLERINFT